CHCFGQIRSSPVGPTTLAFNAALLAAAGLVFLGGYAGDPLPSLIAWTGLFKGFELAILSGGGFAPPPLSAVAMLIWQILPQQGRILLRLDELQGQRAGDLAIAGLAQQPEYDPLSMGAGLLVGEPAPAFELQSAEGGSIGLDHLLKVRK